MKKQFESVLEERKSFKCSICDKKFNQTTVLKIHISSVHEGRKPYECTICNVKYSHKIHLNTQQGVLILQGCFMETSKLHK